MLLTFPQTAIFDSGGGDDEDPIYNDGTWVHPLAWYGASTQMRRVTNRFMTNATTRFGAGEYYGPVGATGDTFEFFVTVVTFAVNIDDSIELSLLTTSGTADATPSGYSLVLRFLGGSAWVLSLERIDVGDYTTVVSTTQIAVVPGCQIGFRRDGVGLRAYIDGVQKLAAIDKTYSAPYFAVFGANDVATGVSTWQLTNVGGGVSG